MKDLKSIDVEQVALTLLRRFGEDSVRQASIRSFELAAYGEQEDAEFWALLEIMLQRLVVEKIYSAELDHVVH